MYALVGFIDMAKASLSLKNLASLMVAIENELEVCCMGAQEREEVETRLELKGAGKRLGSIVTKGFSQDHCELWLDGAESIEWMKQHA